ncbi:MAG: hypothetical protein JNL62_20430 [Bryobacterales bacterium]|nr:hypothetical protein [Bryobacterales bacterium]
MNDLSRELRQGLLDAHPEWAKCIEPAGHGDEPGQCMRLKLPQPGETAEHLWLDTEDGEVTIGFREWHTHSPLWGREVEAHLVEWSLELLHQIMDELVVVVIHYRNGEWAGSSLMAAGEHIVPLDGGEARVYSWRRTHDCVIEALRSTAQGDIL